MYTNYLIDVEMPDGTIKHKAAAIGSGSMTPEQLSDHIERFNMFPGAKNVQVTPVDGPRAGGIADILKRVGPVKNVKAFKGPGNTPRAVLKEPLKLKTPPVPGRVDTGDTHVPDADIRPDPERTSVRNVTGDTKHNA